MEATAETNWKQGWECSIQVSLQGRVPLSAQHWAEKFNWAGTPPPPISQKNKMAVPSSAIQGAEAISFLMFLSTTSDNPPISAWN